MGAMTPLRWVTLMLSLAVLWLLWPLWPPLVLAAWTAALARPLLLRLERGLNGRRRAAGLLTMLIFVLLLLPLALMVIGVVTGVQDVIATVQASASARAALTALTSDSETHPTFPSTAAEVLGMVQRSGTEGMAILTKVAGAAANGLIGLFIYFFGAYAMLIESRPAWDWFKAHTPIESGALDRLAAAFHETGRGLLFGVGLTSLTQGLVATVIYLALDVPRALVLGPVTGIASMIPFVGTGLVWGPIALGLLSTDHAIKAAVLVVLGVGVIGSIDNLLRPFFARMGALKVPPFLLFVSVFGGLATYGAWGAMMGPLVLRLTMEALALNRGEPQAAQATQSVPP